MLLDFFFFFALDPSFLCSTQIGHMDVWLSSVLPPIVPAIHICEHAVGKGIKCKLPFTYEVQSLQPLNLEF